MNKKGGFFITCKICGKKWQDNRYLDFAPKGSPWRSGWEKEQEANELRYIFCSKCGNVEDRFE